MSTLVPTKYEQVAVGWQQHGHYAVDQELADTSIQRWRQYTTPGGTTTRVGLTDDWMMIQQLHRHELFSGVRFPLARFRKLLHYWQQALQFDATTIPNFAHDFPLLYSTNQPDNNHIDFTRTYGSTINDLLLSGKGECAFTPPSVRCPTSLIGPILLWQVMYQETCCWPQQEYQQLPSGIWENHGQRTFREVASLTDIFSRQRTVNNQAATACAPEETPCHKLNT